MALLPHGPFDANEVEPSTGIGPDPSFTGWHPAQITESENKVAKSGRGEYYQMTWEITDGPFKGRKLWSRLNLVNESQTAVDIAYRELSAICRAVGALNIKDTSELHHRPCLVNVIYKPANGDKQAQNDIASGGYKPIGAGNTAPPAPKPAPTGSTPPWKKAG